MPYSRWILFPVIIYLVSIFYLQGLNGDYVIAQIIYGAEGGSWVLKKHWLTETLIHKWGHHLVIALYISIMGIYVISFRNKRLSNYNSGLKYLVIGIPLGTLIVSLLKHVTHISCPWDLTAFGGDQPYFPWVRSILESNIKESGQCFPAGHASSAYTYFTLFFFSRNYFPDYAKTVLLCVLFFGLIYGVSQQLRGAHFLSHDLTSALICWFSSLALWIYFSRENTLKKSKILIDSGEEND
ncbi:MAG: phosphatase PAP2 family protein [Pseudomonadota bacterium]|jgi:membrane-associated PAP2 superfamily phosphatase|uniref:Phosphatidic acid phosphatase type 2/haloperoxidase domain-containing protein n=1 Tax=Methylophaga aminisulfidivorans MP TaxID=1026882 RepID=F5T0T8_9GAMM|nr:MULTISPECIES: phosphatase PAP2 family protein [Methylophaga]EGL53940.1 hypothetical protein MAMP_00303 [Methylophaga aminisulfidivorans MP]MEC9413743.1 phosphatase PAP2 family protein [Pseudomonadota bacterium]WVI83704.1 phosphatase PAP2 family protein [Methylophaga thalassica]HIC46510.1 phosphatase PAP2 family protein [Methylophaga sp.]